MRKIHILITAGIILFGLACSSPESQSGSALESADSSATSTTKPQEEMKTGSSEKVTSPDINYTISDWQVGLFQIQSKVQLELAPYEIRKNVEMVEGEGEPYEEVTYIASLNGEDHIILSPRFDLKTQEYNDKIVEIEVIAGPYKTPLGIGLGSTVEEFTSAYPNAECFYSYVSDTYWLETGSEGTQFHLDPNNFKGTTKGDSDLEKIDPSDFDSGSRILRVRMF